jgi:hypothetical protein
MSDAKPAENTTLGPAPRRRVIHRAAKINEQGGVSARCFKRPRAIDLRRASWTIRDEAVTCPKCAALIVRRWNE